MYSFSKILLGPFIPGEWRYCVSSRREETRTHLNGGTFHKTCIPQIVTNLYCVLVVRWEAGEPEFQNFNGLQTEVLWKQGYFLVLSRQNCFRKVIPFVYGKQLHVSAFISNPGIRLNHCNGKPYITLLQWNVVVGCCHAVQQFIVHCYCV